MSEIQGLSLLLVEGIGGLYYRWDGARFVPEGHDGPDLVPPSEEHGSTHWTRLDTRTRVEVCVLSIPVEIDAANVKAGETGAGGWDVDVSFAIGGKTIEGEVTLLPHEQSGRPSSWGHLSNWASPEIIVATRALSHESRKEILDAIEFAASAEIERSGVRAGAKDRGSK